MKDINISQKIKKKEKLSKGIIDITALIKVAQTSSSDNLARKYMW